MCLRCGEGSGQASFVRTILEQYDFAHIDGSELTKNYRVNHPIQQHLKNKTKNNNNKSNTNTNINKSNHKQNNRVSPSLRSSSSHSEAAGSDNNKIASLSTADAGPHPKQLFEGPYSKAEQELFDFLPTNVLMDLVQHECHR